jgi:hypothetical protein
MTPELHIGIEYGSFLLQALFSLYGRPFLPMSKIHLMGRVEKVSRLKMTIKRGNSADRDPRSADSR